MYCQPNPVVAKLAESYALCIIKYSLNTFQLYYHVVIFLCAPVPSM